MAGHAGRNKSRDREDDRGCAESIRSRVEAVAGPLSERLKLTDSGPRGGGNQPKRRRMKTRKSAKTSKRSAAKPRANRGAGLGAAHGSAISPERQGAYATIAAACFNGPIPAGHRAWLDAQTDEVVVTMADNLQSQNEKVSGCPTERKTKDL